MIGHENTMRAKLLTCALALTLVFGLSAVPALAAPGDDEAEQAAAQSEEVATSATKSTPAAESAPAASSEKTPQAPSGNSWTGGDQAANSSGDASGTSEKESLNPAEKVGAVFAAEGERAINNATGKQRSSYEDNSTPAEDPYSDIVGKVNEPDFGTYTPGVSTGAKLTIKKSFKPAPTIATTETNGKANAADITVSFKLKAERMDKHGYIVCKNSKGNMLMVNDAGAVFDYHGNQMYWDSNNNLVSKAGDGEDAVYSDTDGYSENRDPISKKNGELITVNEGGYLYEDYDNNRYFFDEDKTCIYIDEEDYILTKKYGDRVSPEKKIKITTVDPKSFKACDKGALGLEPIIVCDRQVDIVVGAEMGARTITGLPYPARYYLEERTYPGCGYEFTSVEPASPFVLDENNRELTVTFTNKSTDTGIPSSGAVNSYTFDDNGNMKADRIEDFTSSLDRTN